MGSTHRIVAAQGCVDTPSRGNLTLIDEFVAQSTAGVATRTKYRTHLLEFARWSERSGCMDLLQVRTGQVARFMAYLRSGDRFAAAQHHRVAQTASGATRKNIRSSLCRFYRYLESVELVPKNPVLAVESPKARHTPGLVLTADEVRRILDAPGQPRERIQVYLLTYTGAREHEIRQLRWQDIDFQNQTMLLRGKNHKHRAIDIHPRLMGELRRWLLAQEEHAYSNARLRAAKSNAETDFVLLTSRGRQLSHSVIIKQLKQRAARAGVRCIKTADKGNVSAVHPHALRRTFGTLLLNDGHHLDAVADVLGHASVNTTRKHYAFSSTERRRETIHGLPL